MSDHADNLAVTKASGQDTPAADLGELWQVLDTLPQAEPPEDLLATTIEMVAVRAHTGSGRRSGRGGSRFTSLRRDLWQWLAPAVAVLTAILIGYWLGQATAVVPSRDAEREAWRERREAAIRESFKNDPEARRLFREKLGEAEAADPSLRPPRPLLPDDRRPSAVPQSRPPVSRQPRPGDPERTGPPRKKFPGPRGAPGGQPPVPPAAGRGATTFPSPPSPPAE